VGVAVGAGVADVVTVSARGLAVAFGVAVGAGVRVATGAAVAVGVAKGELVAAARCTTVVVAGARLSLCCDAAMP
jgi:hypothetical protein